MTSPVGGFLVNPNRNVPPQNHKPDHSFLAKKNSNSNSIDHGNPNNPGIKNLLQILLKRKQNLR